MKNILKPNSDTCNLIKIISISIMMFCSMILLFSLGLSSLGLDLKDPRTIEIFLIINYQIFSMLLIFLTLFIVIPRYIMLLIGILNILPPITFFNYLDGGGCEIHITIMIVGFMYIISKFYENDVNQSEFWLFKGLTIILSGIDLLITSGIFSSFKLPALATDFSHRVLISLVTFTMIVGLILVILLLLSSINKIYEYIIGFGLLFISILFFSNQEFTIGQPILTGMIALIFLAYVTFFQNEKYHNL